MAEELPLEFPPLMGGVLLLDDQASGQEGNRTLRSRIASPARLLGTCLPKLDLGVELHHHFLCGYRGVLG